MHRAIALLFLGCCACSTSHSESNSDGEVPDGGSGEDAGSDDDGGGGTGTIGPEGGEVSAPDGASVTVPPGALSAPTDIGVEVVAEGFPELPADAVARGSVHAFTPHGQAFDLPVTVTVPFEGVASADLRLLTSPAGGAWTEVAGAAVDGAAMRSDVEHFSFFVVIEPVGAAERCVGIGCPDAFDPEGGGSSHVVVDVDGALVLDSASGAPHVIWIPNAQQATISKIDTVSRTETARYRTRPVDENPSPMGSAVDFRGDVFTADGGLPADGALPLGMPPSATKVASADCDDRGDGVVDTSSAPDDVLDWATGNDWEDDCIVWSTPLEDPEVFQGNRVAIAVQQVLGVDGALEELVWLGIDGGLSFSAFDAGDGSDTGRTVDVSPVRPYGATLDRDGFLWTWGTNVIGPSRVDTSTDTVDCAGQSCSPPGGFCQGIAIDEEGDVWCGGDPHVYRAATDEWEEIPIPDGINESVSNLAPDGRGHVYIPATDGFGGDAWFYRIDRADATDVTTIDAGITTSGGFQGISIDLDGFVWGVGHYTGNSFVLDPSDDGVETVLNDCPGGYPVEVPGSTGCLYGGWGTAHMTPFDIIGAASPVGEYRQVFQCDGGAPVWNSLAWDADVPAKTSLALFARTADDLASLDLAAWTTLARVPADVSPMPIDIAFAGDGVVAGAYLEVRMVLTSIAHDATPLVRSFEVSSTCE